MGKDVSLRESRDSGIQTVVVATFMLTDIQVLSLLFQFGHTTEYHSVLICCQILDSVSPCGLTLTCHGYVGPRFSNHPVHAIKLPLVLAHAHSNYTGQRQRCQTVRCWNSDTSLSKSSRISSSSGSKEMPRHCLILTSSAVS